MAADILDQCRGSARETGKDLNRPHVLEPKASFVEKHPVLTLLAMGLFAGAFCKLMELIQIPSP